MRASAGARSPIRHVARPSRGSASAPRIRPGRRAAQLRRTGRPRCRSGLLVKIKLSATRVKIALVSRSSSELGSGNGPERVCACLCRRLRPAETGEAEHGERWFGRSPRYSTGSGNRSLTAKTGAIAPVFAAWRAGFPADFQTFPIGWTAVREIRRRCRPACSAIVLFPRSSRRHPPGLFVVVGRDAGAVSTGAGVQCWPLQGVGVPVTGGAGVGPGDSAEVDVGAAGADVPGTTVSG